MKFEELVNGKLWAVRDDDANCHELEILLDHWNDVVWLRDFFIKNQEDLKGFYHVNIEDAIWDTIEDSDILVACLCHPSFHWSICHNRWGNQTYIKDG